jgi:hypothetical protein
LAEGAEKSRGKFKAIGDNQSDRNNDIFYIFFTGVTAGLEWWPWENFSSEFWFGMGMQNTRNNIHACTRDSEHEMALCCLGYPHQAWTTHGTTHDMASFKVDSQALL